MHFDNGFSNQSSTEKGPKRHQKVTTGNSGKVKQWIRDRSSSQYSKEPDSLDQIVHKQLSARHKVEVLRAPAALMSFEKFLKFLQIFIVFILDS